MIQIELYASTPEWSPSPEQVVAFKRNHWSLSAEFPYSGQPGKEEKLIVKKGLEKYFNELALEYKKYVERAGTHNETHCQKILSLINRSSKFGRGVLAKNKFRFGVAQKLLNLFLKYIWIIKTIQGNRVQPPPHCPIDSIICKKLEKKLKEIKKEHIEGTKKIEKMVKNVKNYKWTRDNQTDNYKKVIDSIKYVLKISKENYTIAEWELRNWGPS